MLTPKKKPRKDKGTTKSLKFREQRFKKYKNKDVFVKDSTYARHRIKQRIIEYKLIPYICSVCETLPTWEGEKLILVLDHINGINNDNRLKNLRFVCPNCESQLPTYKSKNITYQKQKKIKEEL